MASIMTPSAEPAGPGQLSRDRYGADQLARLVPRRAAKRDAVLRSTRHGGEEVLASGVFQPEEVRERVVSSHGRRLHGGGLNRAPSAYRPPGPAVDENAAQMCLRQVLKGGAVRSRAHVDAADQTTVPQQSVNYQRRVLRSPPRLIQHNS